MTNSQRLREATKEDHDKTELFFHAQGVFDGSFTLDHYFHLLVASQRYIASIQAEANEWYPQYSQLLQRKMQALDTDLIAAGLKRQPSTSFTPTSSLELLGYIYVIVGSMLGNSVMYRHLAKLTLFKEQPFCYMQLHQEEISPLWKAFVAELDDIDVGDFDQVIEGAKKGYHHLTW